MRTHLRLSDVFTAMERNGDFATAKRLGKEFVEDMRLLEDLGWHEDNGASQVELTMPPEGLRSGSARKRRVFARRSRLRGH